MLTEFFQSFLPVIETSFCESLVSVLSAIFVGLHNKNTVLNPLPVGSVAMDDVDTTWQKMHVSGEPRLIWLTRNEALLLSAACRGTEVFSILAVIQI